MPDAWHLTAGHSPLTLDSYPRHSEHTHGDRFARPAQGNARRPRAQSPVLGRDDRSGGQLDIDDSALYQSLHRLEERGLVEAEWGVTENNRRARYYALTSEGRAHLRSETNTWLRYSRTVTAILTAARAT